MNQIENIEKKLKKLTDNLSLMFELIQKSKSRSYSDIIVFKNIEDGLLKNIKFANKKQIEFLKKEYNWIYYTKEYIINFIDIEYLRKEREHKLKRIL